MVAILLENNKIRNATHPAIMAYRIAVPDKPGVFHQDYDDDGEAAAGGRLLHLLQVAGAPLQVFRTVFCAINLLCLQLQLHVDEGQMQGNLARQCWLSPGAT